jgi:hypothetical protein
MGDINQLIFIRKYVEQLEGPFLEIGSKNYGSTQDLRALFANKDKYVGVDMEDGSGVDVVLDLTEDFEQIDAKLCGQRFGTIFCLSVLEHCGQPFKMAENSTLLLREKGRICVSVPFSWKIHGYPNDYWRFTPEGIKRLFPRVDFDKGQSLAATSKENEFQKLDAEFGKISFSLSKHRKNGHTLRGVSARVLKMLSHFGVLSWLTGYRYLYAPTNILMIGQLKDV